MKAMTPGDHVASMRASLQMLDLQVGRSTLSAAGIADLKREIDNVRLRIWAIMTSEAEKGGPGSLERFRILRAIEITTTVAEELERASMSPSHAELDTLDKLGPRLNLALQTARGRSST